MNLFHWYEKSYIESIQLLQFWKNDGLIYYAKFQIEMEHLQLY